MGRCGHDDRITERVGASLPRISAQAKGKVYFCAYIAG